MQFRNAALAAMSVTALIAACNIARADPLKIRAGWGNTPTAMAPIIFAKPELLKHYGQSYTMEPVHFAGSAPEITALASGDLTSPFFVLKDGPLKTVEDLKGKVLASNAIGGGLDIGIRAMLRKHHLDDKHDVTIIESPFPTLVPMLEEHKADLISAVPPFSFIAEAKGDVRTLFTLRDSIGTSEFIFDVARKPFIDKNRAALVDFTEDWIRSLRWFVDPKNHDEAVKIVADYTKLPPQSFAAWVFQHQDVYRDPDHRANLKALQETLDVQQQLGIQKTHIEAAQYADQSLVDEAAKRIP
jgi:sulfonate transport system substrate-binding protein